MIEVALYLAYGVLNATAMLAVKSVVGSDVAVDLWAQALRLAAAAALYFAGVGVFLYALANDDATRVFPLAVGATVLVTNLLDTFSQRQTPGRTQLLGTVLILVGISLISASRL